MSVRFTIYRPSCHHPIAVIPSLSSGPAGGQARNLLGPVDWPEPVRGQVIPGRIDGIDQLRLLLPPPGIDFLLPINGPLHAGVSFKVDQPVHPISLRESGHYPLLVLPYSSSEVVGRAGIQDPRPTCQQVYEVAVLSHQQQVPRAVSPQGGEPHPG